MKEKLYKINLLITREQYDLLKAAANKGGISMSKYVNQAIKSFKNPGFLERKSNSNEILSSKLQVRLSRSARDLVKSISQSTGKTYSEIIRTSIFISTKPKDYPSKSSIFLPSKNIRVLWKQGRLQEIFVNYYPLLEQLTEAEILLFAQAAGEAAHFKEAAEAINLIKYSTHTKHAIQTFVLAELVLADIELHKRSLYQAKVHFNSIVDLLHLITDRSSIAYYYCIKGIIETYEENYDMAQDSLERVFNYADIFNHPNLCAHANLRLARIAQSKRDKKSADKYYSRTEEINNTVGNVYFKGWFYMDQAFYAQIEKNDQEALDLTRESLRFYNEAGSYRASYYGTDNVARVHLHRKNMDSAHHLFYKAEKLENTFRPEGEFSYTKLLKWYIEAKHSAEDSLAKMEEMIINRKPVFYPSYGKYIYYTTMLQDSQGRFEEEGMQGLKKLSVESNSLLIREASLRTLETKELEPIR